MIITVANTKGGVGKTTTAILLGIAYSRNHTVRVLDADPQGSASEWAAVARSTGHELPFPVEAVNLSTLRRLSPAPGVVTIIDTPPGDASVVTEACAKASLTVIPTAASGLDMERTWETYEALSGKPRAILITNADTRTVLHRQVLEALEEADAAYFNSVILKRQAIRDAYGDFPAELHSYDQLATEIEEAIA